MMAAVPKVEGAMTLLRRLFSLAALLSLAFCIAAAVTWAWHPALRCTVPRTHFTLVTQRGGVELYRPPAAGKPWPALVKAVHDLRNDQLEFQVWYRSARTDEFQVIQPFARQGSPASQIAGHPYLYRMSPEERALLLAALDEPDRFAAAHMLLTDDLRSGRKPMGHSISLDGLPLGREWSL